ncbi:MAG: type II toxin-antitoxin system RelE/ParE family toxin [Deltaproteobacteria bacterium]|nr:type II toxin-antitoxin system RelE/ParE family toxin [Deltaproteobacteria bacterium]
MIKSFSDKETKKLFDGKRSKIPADLQRRALNKLVVLNASPDIDFLRIPPSNQLEALKGDLIEFHSIRINDQWRIVFKFIGSDTYEVAVTNYH